MKTLKTVCALALAMVGCAENATNVARMSVSAAATIGRTAGDLVASYTSDRQLEIEHDLAATGNVDKAKQDRDQHRTMRTGAVKALRVYNAGVVGAGVTTELAALKKDTATLARVVTELAALAVPLRDALKAFGVSIPGGL